VRKGDALFTLDDREMQAQIARGQAQLAKDNASLAQAQADLRRKQELIEKKVAPQQQLDQAVSAYKAAQQTVEADEAVLRADRLKLGYATRRSRRSRCPRRPLDPARTVTCMRCPLQ
jgi:multidrug efflux system membrane fusion protein